MRISVDRVVSKSYSTDDEQSVLVKSRYLNGLVSEIKLEGCFAYPPFINSHDHLIGNWYPPAIDNDLYPNAHIWVKEMKNSDAVKERDRVWVNSIPMNFMRGDGKLLALLGGYKNIFSGVNTVQDHAPKQKKGYYEMFPIEVIRNYHQCHSLKLGNFWGGDEPLAEWQATEMKNPFILHLGEGLDKETATEFSQLKHLGLLQPNTLIIHGIALSKEEIRACAKAGASICWCPYSNYALIGETLDIETCLAEEVNVVIGTDSTLSGGINLLSEFQFAKSKFPQLDNELLYRMISSNAVKALYLNEDDHSLSKNYNQNLLLIEAKSDDPYDNLLKVNPDDIMLLLHKGKPLYGYRDFLDYFMVDENDYFFYEKRGYERFIVGHPEMIMSTIEQKLGYYKTLPYLPFQK